MTSESKDKTKGSNFKKKTANTVFFRYSPIDNSITRKHFESFFSDIGPVKKCSLIRQEKRQSEANKRDAKGFGFCKFACEEDAISAAKSLNETHLQLDYGQKVQVWVELADDAAATEKVQEKVRPQKDSLPEGTPGPEAKAQSTDDIMALQNKKRTSRVIIRNLSFYASEHNIRQVMEQQFGEVVEINLPLVPTLDESNDVNKKKKRPQHRGFAFVTFANKIVAQKAVNACSGDGQVMIKNRPVAIDFSVPKIQHKRMKQEEMNGGNDTDSESESDNEDEVDNEDENNNENDDGKSNDGEEDSSDESEDGGSVSSQSVSGDGDESMEDEEKEEEDDAAVTPKDSHQHSVFLRNLPFDTTRHDLFTLFSKYGHIDGIYLVKDKETGIEKGTGFIKFRNEGGCLRALEAGKGGEADNKEFKAGKNMLGTDVVSGGIYLKGRRIFVDMAVDRSTADSLKVQRDENGKPIDKKIGKDKRNLYLKGEGRVESNEGSKSLDPDAWENLPETDQLKRGHAHQEKSTKLRSPLFFINPFRLSIRNLSKHVDEKELKELVVRGLSKGVEKKLVTKDDMIAHWRASGEMDTRAILEKVTECEKEGSFIPSFDEKKIKQYIPSVFIDRNFDVTLKQSSKSKAERLLAPSRGFGFVEFTHHAHALACLRELNNNTDYSAGYVSGGKRAMQMKKQRSKKSNKKNVKNVNAILEDGPSGATFVGDDGKVRIPRLIVEFTVENKAKARKQAENKAKSLNNAKKQKLALKEATDDGTEKTEKKKMGRGAQQRA
eukprot:CAMPEP_0176484002 /NCGR_PEP_ID=MMETSP0200_2-20121128/4219_1 /TAXON_ID=947934 /ORGANISM="Chaetoceros sp., Strain GSL56" /LENGTH=776 /DNA_ID=CAMNT_0017880441 /DNA_START=192 /DNA_END=2519 /DNA_ORIENTATION=-